MKIDRLAIQDLAKALSRPIGTLLALAPTNDALYLGEARMRGAEWFAALYHEHQFGRGVYLHPPSEKRVGGAVCRRDALLIRRAPGRQLKVTRDEKSSPFGRAPGR